VPHLATPTPNPSPQGGGGKIAAPPRPKLVLVRQAHCLVASMVVAAALTLTPAGAASAQSPETPAAWRVECTGDGKTLECRAIQQIFQRDTRQLVASVAVRYAPETKGAMMSLLLPLGLNLTEPVSIKVDNGPPERQPIQTCSNSGCLVTTGLNDKFLAAMRTGIDFKLTVQDANKKPIEMSLPLLGFGIAYDKTK
jgi:invasion protein IalB